MFLAPYLAITLRLRLTVADEQEDEGLVLHQVEDGPSVRVIFRRGVRQDSLGVARGEGRAVFYDCREDTEAVKLGLGDFGATEP